MALSQLVGIAWALPMAILLCAGCSPAALVSAQSQPAAEQLRARLRLEQGSLRIDGGASFDLGIVEKGGRRAAIVWLENTSSRDIHVQAMSASCDCMRLFVASDCVPHHGRAPLAIQFADEPDDGFAGALAVELTLTDALGSRHSAGTINLVVSSDEEIRAVWQLASNDFENSSPVVSTAAK